MNCPICGKAATEGYRPFCSRRCSDVDLGRWLTGAYVLPGPEMEDDLPESFDGQTSDGESPDGEVPDASRPKRPQ